MASPSSSARYALFVYIADSDVKTLAAKKASLNLSVGFSTSAGILYNTIAASTTNIDAETNLFWTDVFKMGSEKTSIQTNITYQQTYNLLSDGTANVGNDPSAPIDGFRFSNDYADTTALLYQNFVGSNNKDNYQLISSTNVAKNAIGTIIPTKNVAIWFTVDNVDGEKFYLDFTRYVTQIVAYDSSGDGWSVRDADSTAAGAIIGLSKTSSGYVVSQVPEKRVMTLPGGNDSLDGRPGIDFAFGPIKIEGYIDSNKFEIGVVISIFGISLGTFYGNAKEGVVIKVNLLLAQGQIKFYLKDDKQLWVNINLNILMVAPIDVDLEILSF